MDIENKTWPTTERLLIPIKTYEYCKTKSKSDLTCVLIGNYIYWNSEDVRNFLGITESDQDDVKSLLEGRRHNRDITYGSGLLLNTTSFMNTQNFLILATNFGINFMLCDLRDFLAWLASDLIEEKKRRAEMVNNSSDELENPMLLRVYMDDEEYEKNVKSQIEIENPTDATLLFQLQKLPQLIEFSILQKFILDNEN